MAVPQNYTEARRRFEEAAELGLPSAWNGIGVLHFNGQGTEANLTAARLAFERGAAQNNSDCMCVRCGLYTVTRAVLLQALAS
jgi:TPR repeat protein